MNPREHRAHRENRRIGESENRGKSDEPFSRRYLDALIAGIEGAQERLPEITGAGEAVAERLVAGGDLFIASVRPDFVSEGIVRSGGLMMLRAYGPDTALSQRDTAIVGWSNTTPEQGRALLQRLRENRAFVVGIGPAPPGETSGAFLAHVDAFLESAPPLPPVPGYDVKILPSSGIVQAAIYWAVIGAMSGPASCRRGLSRRPTSG